MLCTLSFSNYKLILWTTFSMIHWQLESQTETLNINPDPSSSKSYLIPHECSDVARLPSRRSTHIQDTFSGTGPEHVSHNHRGKVLWHITFLYPEEWSDVTCSSLGGTEAASDKPFNSSPSWTPFIVLKLMSGSVSVITVHLFSSRRYTCRNTRLGRTPSNEGLW